MLPRRGSIFGGATLLVLSVLLLNAAAGDTYQWVDENGTVWFADSLDKVPPEYRAWAYHNRKKVQEGPSITTTTRGDPKSEAVPSPEPSASSKDPYANWQERITKARAELENLRAQRQKAQTAYDDFIRPTWIPNLRLFPLDPEIAAKASSRISELDQKIRDKEYEITVTIPDEARQAGVPPSVLSQ